MGHIPQQIAFPVDDGQIAKMVFVHQAQGVRRRRVRSDCDRIRGHHLVDRSVQDVLGVDDFSHHVPLGKDADKLRPAFPVGLPVVVEHQAYDLAVGAHLRQCSANRRAGWHKRDAADIQMVDMFGLEIRLQVHCGLYSPLLPIDHSRNRARLAYCLSHSSRQLFENAPCFPLYNAGAKSGGGRRACVTCSKA